MSAAGHRDGFFAARDNLRLYWHARTPERPVASVAVLHGFGEHCGRYGPLFDRLEQASFAVHALDYRGHGQADGRRGHVDHFADYLDDVGRFVDRVRAEAAGGPVFVLGHSLGGLILARWLLEPGNAARIEGAIFSSPFLEMARRPSPLKVAGARLVGKVVPWAPFSSGITSDQLTRDEEMRRLVDRDPLYNRTVSPRWFEEALRAQREVREAAPGIAVPALVLLPEADPVASPAATEAFFERLGSPDRELRRYPGALHEPFNEIPEVRVQAVADVVAWLQKHSMQKRSG